MNLFPVGNKFIWIQNPVLGVLYIDAVEIKVAIT